MHANLSFLNFPFSHSLFLFPPLLVLAWKSPLSISDSSQVLQKSLNQSRNFKPTWSREQTPALPPSREPSPPAPHAWLQEAKGKTAKRACREARQEQHPKKKKQNRAAKRQRESRQGGTDGTQRQRSRGRGEGRDGGAVTLRGAVRKAEWREYLEARI